MAEPIDEAVALWRGIQGAAWAYRNPKGSDDTDVSWRIRFGHSKKVWLRNFLKGAVPNGSTWLDVGCSAGAHMRSLIEIGQSCRHGCDLNMPAMGGVPAAVVADARHLPYADDSFDGVTCSGTLMHTGGEGHLVQALREFDRVARTYILAVELWQPQPMRVDFGDLMPQAWVYPWERAIPSILGFDWTLERCRLIRSCGRLERTQPLMGVLMIRSQGQSEFGMWE
jgi:hypothetical protein